MLADYFKQKTKEEKAIYLCMYIQTKNLEDVQKVLAATETKWQTGRYNVFNRNPKPSLVIITKY